jgi:hypothetical protein
MARHRTSLAPHHPQEKRPGQIPLRRQLSLPLCGSGVSFKEKLAIPLSGEGASHDFSAAELVRP